ncbi:MAG TPA: DUF4870 domain-containing protein [Chthoniobacterales bacterium]|jgi:hypothetical protein|nr:DUF4870 domain-containing protein [Chthoniobacterales bacterium]
MNETQPASPPPPPTPTTYTSAEIRTWCVLCHASALLGLFFHFFGHLLGPLVVWLIKRDASPEIDANGRESLNFQLSMLIYDIVAGILCIVLIGIPILIALWVLNTVFVIIASVKTSNGEFYRYPFTIRFLN